MRSTFLVVLLAACAPRATSTGPAWPKSTASATDGGESIAPHESKQVVVAVEKSEPEAKPAAAPEAKPATPSLVPAGAPAAQPAVGAQPAEEPLNVDDIIIEIDE